MVDCIHRVNTDSLTRGFIMELFKVCYMWRKFANLKQSDIYGIDKVKTVSAFENGRSANLAHFERYYSLAIAMGQKADFEYFLNYHINKGTK